MLAVVTRFLLLLAGLFGFVLIYSHLFSPTLRQKMRQSVSRIAWAFILLSAAYIGWHCLLAFGLV